jgi:hypothetical protein
MPYIRSVARESIDAYGIGAVSSVGDLNYFITTSCDHYLGKDLSYAKINEVIGALECVKLEMYRRLAAPYEDQKIVENGDVYQDRA